MTWDARQRGMLAAMGLRVWGEPAAGVAAAVVDADVDAVAVMTAPPGAPPAISAPSKGSREPAITATNLYPSHWMVIGEPQSAPDAASGLPFTGDAGRLLDNMLRAIGLSRGVDSSSPATQAFLTHALKARPPADESAPCAPYLQQQIAQVQPQIILAMGSFAVQALLGTTEPVGKLRGRVHRCGDVPVIVTYDPAYLLRSPADKAGAWADLCLARDTLAEQAEPLET